MRFIEEPNNGYINGERCVGTFTCSGATGFQCDCYGREEHNQKGGTCFKDIDMWPFWD